MYRVPLDGRLEARLGRLTRVACIVSEPRPLLTVAVAASFSSLCPPVPRNQAREQQRAAVMYYHSLDIDIVCISGLCR